MIVPGKETSVTRGKMKKLLSAALFVVLASVGSIAHAESRAIDPSVTAAIDSQVPGLTGKFQEYATFPKLMVWATIVNDRGTLINAVNAGAAQGNWQQFVVNLNK